ncbi:hypothetical protein A1Q2_04637 [Trichosporon asahii var. asahii CBS 8904]|uniref:Uncharacterized protein n=1 Tax=Trichosporon asahii var. asahii (strain CBS 8904) TaxID=1220162 RepID=K1WID8_TRIAC|nr:hypothetical protein A1Q2_04637 [Trichosporon asahii var. asahii CBS 8904]
MSLGFSSKLRQFRDMFRGRKEIYPPRFSANDTGVIQYEKRKRGVTYRLEEGHIMLRNMTELSYTAPPNTTLIQIFGPVGQLNRSSAGSMCYADLANASLPKSRCGRGRRQRHGPRAPQLPAEIDRAPTYRACEPPSSSPIPEIPPAVSRAPSYREREDVPGPSTMPAPAYRRNDPGPTSIVVPQPSRAASRAPSYRERDAAPPQYQSEWRGSASSLSSSSSMRSERSVALDKGCS